MSQFKIYCYDDKRYLLNASTGKKYDLNILKNNEYINHIKREILKTDNWLESKELWNKHNSSLSWEYHYITSNISFYDYSSDFNNHHIDQIHMNSYHKNELVPQLFNNFSVHKFPIIEFKLEEIEKDFISFDEILNIDNHKKKNDIESIINYIAGIQYFSTSRYEEACHVKRRVPSGGARHVVETYIFNFQKKTIKHYNFVNKTFQTIGTIDKEIIDTFPLLKENEDGFSEFIVFTNVYKRNMFKYRESRTYRPVHIENGHHMSIYKKLLSYNNYKFIRMVNPNSLILNELLSIDGFDECVISAIAIKENNE